MSTFTANGQRRARASRSKYWTFILLGFAVLLAPAPAAAITVTPTIAPLTGSSFQGGDGNQNNPTVGGATRDWEFYANSPSLLTVDDPNTLDTSFTGGSDDLTPVGWEIFDDPAGATPAKANFFVNWALFDADTFLNLAFKREVSGGNTFLSFELNQDKRSWKHVNGTPNSGANTPNRPVQCRTTGDVLISYDIQSGSNLDVIVRKWTNTTSVQATGSDAVNFPGAAGCAKTGTLSDLVGLTASHVQGAINADPSGFGCPPAPPATNPLLCNPITNFLQPGTYGSTFAEGIFGEAAINLSAVFDTGAFGDPCFSFGQINLHSRSSESVSSAMQDLIGPVPITLRSCSISGIKFHDLDGDGTRDVGEPTLAGYKLYLDLDADGNFDAGEPIATTDANGEYVFEELADATYVVRELPAAQQDPPFQNYVCTSPTPCQHTTTIDAAHPNRTGLNFGNWVPPRVTVAKEVLPDGATNEAFLFSSNLPGFLNFTLSDNQNTGVITTGAGSVTISEALDASRFTLAIDCTNVTESTVGASTSFTVQSGDVVVCTFTNTVRPRIVVEKVTDPAGINQNFGFSINTGPPTTFNLNDSSPATDDQSTTVAPGTYTITETGVPGFRLATIVCTGDDTPAVTSTAAGTATVDADAGEVITCVYTNQQLASVEVRKETLPDGLATSFPFAASGVPTAEFGTSFSLTDGASTGAVLVRPGALTIDENPPAGFSVAIVCTGDPGAGAPDNAAGSVVLDVDGGETIVCTFTNTQQPTLTITKATVPAAVDQTFTYTGLGGFTLNASTDPSDDFTVAPGSYPVTETVPTGWDLTALSCTDPDNGTTTAAPTATIDADPGEHISCTFTNTRRASITVEKVTVPAGVNQNFGFTGSAGLGAPFDLNDATAPTRQVLVAPGAYSVSETALTGWDLTGLSCVEDNGTDDSTTVGATATINAQAGETIHCTYTNTKRASVTIVKATDPPGVAQDFSFAATGANAADLGASFTLNAGLPGPASRQALVRPGALTVTETAATGFRLTGVACTGDDANPQADLSTGAVTLDVDAGESISCTYTNSQLARVIVAKETLPDGLAQSFAFTTGSTDLGTGFSLTDGQNRDRYVLPGSITIDEDIPTGFSVAINCVGDPDAGAPNNNTGTVIIDADAGETITCTYTNTQQPTITITKATAPATVDQTFTYTGLGGFTLNASTDPSDDFTVAPGSHVVTETVPAGWDLTSLSCTDPDGGTTTAGAAATIDADPGEHIACTFTNTQLPTITITKATVPAAVNQTFTYTGLGGFDLNASTDPSDDFTVTPGSHAVTETVPAGWDLMGLSCTDPDGGTTTAGATATIDADPGEHISCTYTNTKRASVTIVKATDPPGVAQDFSFAATGANAADLGASFTLNAGLPGPASRQALVRPGALTVTETAATGFRLTGVACTGDDANPQADLSTGAVTLDVDAGESISCTYTNSQLARVIVAKETLPDGLAQSFAFTTGSTDLGTGFSLTDGQNRDRYVLPGSITIDEDIPTGFSVAINCVGDPDAGAPNNTTGTVIIDADAGETITCTYTNTQLPTITITKATVPAAVNQTFSYTGLGGFTLNASTDPSDDFTVAPGSYPVTETVSTGWDLTGLSCTDPDNGTTTAGATATIDADPGEHIACTFTNTKRASVTIEKVTDPAAVNQNFAYTGSAALGLPFNLNDGGTATHTELVVPGSYSVTETAIDGWRLSGLSCTEDNGTDDSTTNAATATINAQAGETIHCTYTNEQLAQVTVRKETQPDASPLSFAFGASGPGADELGASFGLSDGQSRARFVERGDLVIDEDVPTGWNVSSIQCSGDAATPNLSAGSITLDVDPGDVIDCTWTNTQRVAVEIVKRTIPAGVDQAFSFAATGTLVAALGSTFTLNDVSDAADSTTASVLPGTFSVTETAPAGWRLDSVNCTGSAQVTPGANGPTVTATAGQTVSCEFVNRQQARITVIKQTEPDADQTSFAFTGLGAFSLTDGQSKAEYVDPASITIDEAVPAGWDLAAIECSGDPGAGTPDLAAGSIVLDADAGETIECTFRNVKHGTVAITKTEGGGHTLTRAWTFTLTGGPAPGVDLSATTPSPLTFAGLKPGTYTLCEKAVPNDWISSLERPPFNATRESDGDVCVELSLAAGEGKALTVDNTRPQTLVVKEGNVQVHPGDTISYTFDVTNAGNVPLHDLTLSDPRCQTAITRDPANDRNADGDALLENPGVDAATSESWRFVCSYTVPADHEIGDENPIVNTVTATALAPDGTPVSDSDTHTTTVLHPAIAVDKQVRRQGEAQFGDTPVQVRVGDVLEYRFLVTNPGDAGLTIALADPRCDAGTLGAPIKTGGNGDDTLDPGENWTYACSHRIVAGDPDPFPNTVTVTGTDPLGGPDGTVTATDTTTNPVIDPRIAVDKSVRVGNAGEYGPGPVNATVGDTLGYQFRVTNPGDVALTGVTLTDARCNAGTLAGPVKSSGNDDAALDPGETWTWTCTHLLIESDPRPFENTVTVKGTDPVGGSVTATDSVTAQVSLPTQIVNPIQSTLPQTVERPATSARLSSPSGCRPKRFAVRVAGTGISRVTFYVDGRMWRSMTAKRARKVRASQANGGTTQEFRTTINPNRYKSGTHRVSAKIEFVSAARRRSRTLLATFQRCARQVVAPQFTG